MRDVDLISAMLDPDSEVFPCFQPKKTHWLILVAWSKVGSQAFGQVLIFWVPNDLDVGWSMLDPLHDPLWQAPKKRSPHLWCLLLWPEFDTFGSFARNYKPRDIAFVQQFHDIGFTAVLFPLLGWWKQRVSHHSTISKQINYSKWYVSNRPFNFSKRTTLIDMSQGWRLPKASFW